MRRPTEPRARRPLLPPRRASIVAVFGALSLFFSVVEQFIPRPVPFFRVGLSNIPLLLALDFMPFGALALLAGLKVAGQGLLSGTLVSYVAVLSAGGTAASLLSMWSRKRALGERISLLGLGTAGALASNAAQAAIAATPLVFGSEAFIVAPFIMGVGTVTGITMGAFASVFAGRSAWLLAVKAAWKDGGA